MYADEKQRFLHVKVDEDDLALVKQLMAVEKLRKSDILRRAIRAYAKQLGVDAQPEKVG